MRADQTFDRRLYVKIECRSDRAAESGVSRRDCIHKMRRKAGRLTAQNFRRLRKQRLLVACDNSQIGEPPERSRVFTICFLWMAPRIEASWRLRQTGQENCFAQSEIASRFPEIRASSGLRTESPIPVAAAIQVFRQNSLLAPAPFQFPSEDCLVKFAAPTASVAAVREFHELLGDRGCARNNMPRSQIPCARGNGGAPVNAAVLVKPPVLQRHGHAWQPRSHLLERDWKLSTRFRRRQLGNFAAA